MHIKLCDHYKCDEISFTKKSVQGLMVVKYCFDNIHFQKNVTTAESSYVNIPKFFNP
jgi:hypothetical protein